MSRKKLRLSFDPLTLRTNFMKQKTATAAFTEAYEKFSQDSAERCVYCTGTGIELQLPEVPSDGTSTGKG